MPPRPEYMVAAGSLQQVLSVEDVRVHRHRAAGRVDVSRAHAASGRTPLHDAVAQGDIEQAEFLCRSLYLAQSASLPLPRLPFSRLESAVSLCRHLLA